MSQSILEQLLECITQEERSEDLVRSIVNSMARSWNLNDRARDYLLQASLDAKRSKTHYRIAAVFAAAASLCTQDLDGIVALIPIFRPNEETVMTAICVKTGLQPNFSEESIEFPLGSGVTIH
ncbi:MAG: hypothetical protein U0518_04570 [Candidatus Gracilibacteria bacterium]